MKKNKNITKKEKLKYIMFIILTFLLGTIFGLLIGKLSKTKTENFTINVNGVGTKVIKEYYRSEENGVYLYNISEVEVNDNNKIMTLSEYIEEYNDLESFMANLSKHLDVRKTLHDGGTIIYEGKKNTSYTDKITIIKCNTNDGNKDIYIGSGNMNTTEAFKNGACGKNFFEDKVFERIYYLRSYSKSDLKDNEYILYLADDFGNEYPLAYKLEKDLIEKLKNIEELKFKFENPYGELIKEDIRDIFEKCTIKSIEINE